MWRRAGGRTKRSSRAPVERQARRIDVGRVVLAQPNARMVVSRRPIGPRGRDAVDLRGGRRTTAGDVRWVWSGVPNVAEVALQRTQAIVARLPDVERSDNPLGCYFLVRRKIFAQVATVVDPGGQPATIVAMRPDPEERDALIATGHPYFSRGPWDERLGRIAVLIDARTDWDEIAELVTDSYRLTAPKKLVAKLGAPDHRLGNE
jgi:predicted DNA-binding protein (MmcQ/YjbR family)